MTTSVELVALKCPRCATLIEAEEEEVAWACKQCGQGMLLTDSGLAPLTVNWAAARENAKDVEWRPFWVFSGRVSFSQRQSFGRQTEPDKLWDAPRRFCIPAYPASLQQIETLGADFTRRQTPLQAGRAAGALSDCVLFPGDARQAVEFVVLTIEANRKDKLRSVEFSLDLGEPELWVLPFEGGKLACAD